MKNKFHWDRDTLFECREKEEDILGMIHKWNSIGEKVSEILCRTICLCHWLLIWEADAAPAGHDPPLQPLLSFQHPEICFLIFFYYSSRIRGVVNESAFWFELNRIIAICRALMAFFFSRFTRECKSMKLEWKEVSELHLWISDA